MNFKKILVVDDEPAARRKLKSTVTQLCISASITEACDGDEAVELILSNEFDLVFMDIQMPGINGLEAAIKTQNKPYHLIFVTAFDEYAIDAFETYAIDYLLKPVTVRKLQQTLNKIIQLNKYTSTKQLLQLTKEIQNKKSPAQLAIRSGNSTIIINADHICYLEALSGYCRLVLTLMGQQVYNTDTIITDTSLEFIHQQLPQESFLRIHRKHVINVAQILSYHSISRRMYLKIRDFSDVSIPVSRRNTLLVKKRWQTL